MRTLLSQVGVLHHRCSILASLRPFLLPCPNPHVTSSAPHHVFCPAAHVSLASAHGSPVQQSPVPLLQRRTCWPVAVVRPLQTERGGSARREERWRRRDQVPSEYRLVYAAPSEVYVRCAAGAVIAPLLLTVPAVLLRPAELLLLDWQVLLVAGLYGLLASGVLLLARRYVFRMYHSASRREFHAVLTGPLLVTSRHVTLREGSVSRAQTASNLLPWRSALYSSTQGKLVLMDSGFQSAEMYNRLLGYHSEGSPDDESES